MNREPLKNKSLIHSEKYEYVITRKIGEGASCIVYDAECTDNGCKYKRRIKECFPLGSAFFRDSDGSIGKGKDKFDFHKNRFVEAYNRMVDLGNEISLSNLIVTPIECFEYNNTVYSVFGVDQGMDYEAIIRECEEKKHFGSLKELFIRFKLISDAAEKFHEKKVLLLDIKPQNIFIMNTNPETIKFFDFDSIVRKEEIENNSLEYISFSEGFAAPEQLTEDKVHISEKTDIYFIGSMLYYVLFGEHYDYVNGIIGDPITYSTMRFPDYQPKLEKKLNEFFSKALAILPEDRFENMAEMSNQFDELIGLSESLYNVDVGCEFLNIRKIHEEFKAISKRYDCKSLGRYIVLVKYIAENDPVMLESLGKISDRQYLEDVAKTYADIESEITGDDLCLGIWAQYSLFKYFNNNEALKKCKELYEKYSNDPHDGKYSMLIIPFNKYNIMDNLMDIHDKSELIDQIKLLWRYFDYDMRDIMDHVIDKIKSYPRLCILLRLFVVIYSNALCSDELVNKGGRDKYFDKAEELFLASELNDEFIKRAIKCVADMKGYDTSIIPEEYNYPKAKEELAREFEKQFGISPEGLQYDVAEKYVDPWSLLDF